MINRLREVSETVLTQETTFSVDMLGRFICNTWDEAVNNGGLPFDAVVIGGGMYGAYCAEKIYRAGGRVLVLEAGPFLASEHIQNLTQMGLNAPGPARVFFNQDDPKTRSLVWGNPWHSAESFPGLAYCVGGRSIFWGGWSPRLTNADLAQWPAELVTYLANTYPPVEEETGVNPTTDYISGPLFQTLFSRFQAVQGAVPTVDGIEEAPLAVQGAAPAPGLFSFDKYSSAPILSDAVREDVNSGSPRPDSLRRLFVVPRAHVVRLNTSGGQVVQIELYVNGQHQFLNLSPDCSVVLAASTIESTRLALESFPTALMGRNLMAHLRSNTTVRIKRSVFSGLQTPPTQLEAAALLVRGSTTTAGGSRRYHFQVTAADVQGPNPEKNMFRMIPDIDLQHQIQANQDPNWIVITLRGIGEMGGDKNAMPQNAGTSWINLTLNVPDQQDEFFMRRAWVNLVKTADDDQLWRAMDDAAIALAQQLANNNPANIQYFYDGGWQTTPPPPSTNNRPNDPNNKVRDGLGTTHHEAGTLWMGTDSTTSVTDLNGRFHHIGNAYVAGPAIFPTLGSANPSLTAFSLARRTASAIAVPTVETGFTPLFTGSLADWQMAGSGRFNAIGNTILESEGGIGLLWYTKAEFADFILKVDWRSSSIFDNSGVFIRFPLLGSSDPANDWKLAVDKGYEIQIDDRGYNPDTNSFGDALHETGAIYTFAAASRLASKPIGQWNVYEIQAQGNNFTVKLNGEIVSKLTGDGSRPLKGHIGLQNHHPGSRVQFRNIRIKPL